jgi:hypothetical protein
VPAKIAPTVTVDIPGTPGLLLARDPRYLRFTMKGNDPKTLDALDQLDDTPEPGERVFAAARGESFSAHVLRGSKPKGGGPRGSWERYVSYKVLEVQPPEDVLRDTAKWREWCFERMGGDNAGTDDAGGAGAGARGAGEADA